MEIIQSLILRLSRKGQNRSDVNKVEMLWRHLVKHENIEANINVPDIFWQLQRPTIIKFGEFGENVKPESIIVEESKVSFPLLPDDMEETFLHMLDELESQTRIIYQPDVDPGSILDGLFTYIHIAAARAFRLKCLGGYNDDVEQGFEASLKLIRWMGIKPDDMSDAPIDFVSSGAIAALILIEFFQMKRIDAKYGEALHLLAEGLQYITQDIEEPPDWIKQDNPDDVDRERQLRVKLKECLALIELNPQEVVHVFEAIRSREKCDNWKQLVNDCKIIAEYWDWCGKGDERCIDLSGKETPLLQFWHISQGWAEAQLNPYVLRTLMREREDETAKNRLQTYFFNHELWKQLPEKTQRSLVDADRAWHSTKMGRIESIFNDLKIAAESICYSFIWKGVSSWANRENIGTFISKENHLKRINHEPTLVDYSWVLRQPFFIEFLNKYNIEEKEQIFLIEKLPSVFDELCTKRNISEHGPKYIANRADVGPIFKAFMGIGQEGILPRMAEIKKKITP